MIIRHSNMQGKVSPERAEEWLNFNAFPNQRPLKVKHRDFLANEIAAGRFIQGTQIHFVVFGKNKFLVNGQHTLSAILKTGISVLLAVLTTTVDSMEDVVKIYLGHDPKGTERSTLDSARANGIHIKMGLTLTQIKKVTSAIKFIKGGFSALGTNISDNDLFVETEKWAEEASAFYETLKSAGYSRGMVENAPILSVALVTFRFQEVKAKFFWNLVATNEGMLKNDPRRVLHERLSSMMLRSEMIHGKNVITPLYISRVTAHAWNAFYAGKKIKTISITGQEQLHKIRIDGTTYTGETIQDESAAQ